MTHYNSMNVLSMHALIAAYSKEGMEWVDELRTVLDTNISYAMEFIRREFPGVSVSRPQGRTCSFRLHRLVRGASPDH